MTNEVIKNHAITGMFSKRTRKELEGISDKYSRSRKQEEKKKGLVPKSRDGEKKRKEERVEISVVHHLFQQ